jgi:hypothetical protein
LSIHVRLLTQQTFIYPRPQQRHVMSDTDMREAINEAVLDAQTAYKSAEKNPIGHGHAFIKGLDGRTKVVQELAKHPEIDVEKGGYHGTTLHINNVSRFLDAQRSAYKEFQETLTSLGVEAAEDWHIWTHAD